MPDRRLSGLDAACLAVESARAPLHTVAVLLLDASAEAGGEAGAPLVQALGCLVDRSVRLRACVVDGAFGLIPPTFEDEGPPDLEHHLSRVRVPRPGGPRELARVVDDVLARPLPRGCPLWEMHLVEGLASGATALVVKLHCVPLDGATAAHVALALAEEPVGLRRLAAMHAPSAPDGGRVPDAGRGLVDWLTRTPGRVARASAGLVGVAARGLRGPAPGASPRPTPPAGSRLNGPTAGGRRSAHATLRASSLERVAKAFAVAPDDVVLAIIAGALRVELAAAGETHTHPLVAAVMRESAAGEPGWPRMTLERLPTHVALPAARVRLVHRDQESGPDVLPTAWRELAEDLAEATAPAALAWLARAASDLGLESGLARLANCLVSFGARVEAPPRIEGLRIEHLYAYGPLPEGIHLHLAAQRIGAAVDVGVTAAGDVLPDPWRFAAALGDALRELHEAALALEER
jgi:WS/DGAT/MGAT family acyltransferase